MSWTIYCHIHIDSQRRYIGLTSQTIEKRWNQHISKSKSSKGGRWHFPNAIRKFGKDAFSHEVLEICETLESANEAEIKWIDHFNSRDPQFGFNLALGGSHTPHPYTNPWDRPEYREKMEGVSKRTWSDPKKRAEASIISRAAALRPEVKIKCDAFMNSHEYRSKVSIISKKKWEDPEYRLKLLASMNGRWSPELRAEASNTSKENWQDPEYRSKIGIIHQSIEFKTLISSIVTGRRLDAETCLNLSRKNSGKKLSLNTRGKIASSLKGRTLSGETRRKISEARRRQSISPETRAKIASSNTGKRHSDESRANMSVIQKKLARERINA